MAFGSTFKSKDDTALAADDMESLLRKSRRDILGLKIMVYTAVILLAGGFLYYNNELESSQKDFQMEMQGTQHQLDTLLRERSLNAETHLESIVEEMNNTISRLDKEPPQVKQLIERVKEDSGDFLHTYRQYSGENAAEVPLGFE